LTIHPSIARLERKRLEGGLAIDAFLHDAEHIVRVQYCTPVKFQCRFVPNPKELQVCLICEGARTIRFANTHRNRRTVCYQSETLFALTQRLSGKGAISDVDMCTNEP
jgi:hypothetical protein